ncbi:glycosyltransferase [Salisediminibacterium halotolerans]|uniref:glycosyltransferase n=1 Tax=Salisediminibacterium halotolerans TaxID=517425 RepID=UPI001F556503
MADAGYDVTLIAKKYNDVPNNVSGVNYIGLRSAKRRFISMFLTPIQAYLTAKKMKADIYHFHDPEFLPFAKFLKKPSNKVVYDIHEDYETGIVTREYFTYPIRKMMSFLYKRIENWAVKGMEIVLAEKYYQEKYPDGTQILNYPRIENADSPRTPRDFANNHELLYTGNITEDRGAFQHALLPIHLEGIDVTMVGKCPAHLYKAMKDAAGSFSDHLTVVGVDRFIPKGEIDEYYLADRWIAGVALFPDSDHYRRKELTKFFEYMYHGLPVVCSNFPEWKAFMHKYNCGLTVDPDSPEQIKEAVNYLRDNPEEAREMGENGFTAVLETLNWRVQAEKLIALYENRKKGTG